MICVGNTVENMFFVPLKSSNSLETPKMYFPNGTKNDDYSCSISLKYKNKDFRSKYFNYPVQNKGDSSTSRGTEPMTNKNVLVWAIPVALVALALLLGLGVMFYKYRRLQYSFLAFAARGSYTRQEDELDDADDDNMIVGFRSGNPVLCLVFWMD